MEVHDRNCRRSLSFAYCEQTKRLSQLKLTTKEQMMYEVARLNTFFNGAPCNPVNFGILAEAGFYYDNINSIRCSFCFSCYPLWDANIVLKKDVRCTNPGCGGKDSGNISLMSDAELKDNTECSSNASDLSSIGQSTIPSGKEQEPIKDVTSISYSQQESLSPQINTGSVGLYVRSIAKVIYGREKPRKKKKPAPLTEPQLLLLSEEFEKLSLKFESSTNAYSCLDSSMPTNTGGSVEVAHEAELSQSSSNMKVTQTINRQLQMLQNQQDRYRDRVSSLQMQLVQKNKWLDAMVGLYLTDVKQLQKGANGLKNKMKRLQFDPLRIIMELEETRERNKKVENELKDTRKELRKIKGYKKCQERELKRTTKKLQETIEINRILTANVRHSRNELQDARREKEELERNLCKVTLELQDKIKAFEKLKQDFINIVFEHQQTINSKEELENDLKKTRMQLQETEEVKTKVQLDLKIRSKELQDSQKGKEKLEHNLRYTLTELKDSREAKKELEMKHKDTRKELQVIKGVNEKLEVKSKKLITELQEIKRVKEELEMKSKKDIKELKELKKDKEKLDSELDDIYKFTMILLFWNSNAPRFR